MRWPSKRVMKHVWQQCLGNLVLIRECRNKSASIFYGEIFKNSTFFSCFMVEFATFWHLFGAKNHVCFKKTVIQYLPVKWICWRHRISLFSMFVCTLYFVFKCKAQAFCYFGKLAERIIKCTSSKPTSWYCAILQLAGSLNGALIAYSNLPSFTHTTAHISYS